MRDYIVSYYGPSGLLFSDKISKRGSPPKPNKRTPGATWAAVDEVTGGVFVEVHRHYFSGRKIRMGG